MEITQSLSTGSLEKLERQLIELDASSNLAFLFLKTRSRAISSQDFTVCILHPEERDRIRIRQQADECFLRLQQLIEKKLISIN